MTIIDALKSKENVEIRYGNGENWMYWNDTDSVWEVRTKEYHKRGTKLLISTPNEELAIKVLLTGGNQ